MVRERNPETWFASWASSAPVEAQVDMSVYFNPMEQVGQRSPWLQGENDFQDARLPDILPPTLPTATWSSIYACTDTSVHRR